MLYTYVVSAGQAQPSAWGTLFAGGMAGIFNWLGCIPIDTLKTKLQTAPEGTLYLPLFSAPLTPSVNVLLM